MGYSEEKRHCLIGYKQHELDKNLCGECGGMIFDWAREYSESVMCSCIVFVGEGE